MLNWNNLQILIPIYVYPDSIVFWPDLLFTPKSRLLFYMKNLNKSKHKKSNHILIIECLNAYRDE